MPTTKTLPKKKPVAKKTVPAARAKSKTTTPSNAEQTPHDTTAVVEKAAALHPTSTLIARIPDASVAERYVGRKVGTLDDMEVLDYAYETGANVLIEGPTGPGKTMLTRAWAAKRGKLLARIPSNNGIDASQLFGKYIPDETSGGFCWQDGPVPHVFRVGGVILWNEINFTPERVGSVMFGALDDQREIVLLDHKSETLRAHRGAQNNCWCDLDPDDCDDRRVLIIADQNPGYSGTRELNAALRNRFAIQLHWDYDPAVEAQLIKSPSLRTMAQQIRDQAEANSYETPISTNMLMEFEKMAQDINIDFAAMNFINHFRSDERESIKLVVVAHTDGIANDYRSPLAPAPTQAASASNADDADDLSDDDDLAKWIFTSDN